MVTSARRGGTLKTKKAHHKKQPSIWRASRSNSRRSKEQRVIAAARAKKAGVFIARAVTAAWLPRLRNLANDTTECPQPDRYVHRNGSAIACPIGLEPILCADAYYMNGACYDIHNLASHFVHSPKLFCPLTKNPVTTTRVVRMSRAVALWGSKTAHKLRVQMTAYRRDQTYAYRSLSLYRSLLLTLCDQVMHMVADITKQANVSLGQQRGVRDDRQLLNAVIATPAWSIAADKISEYHAVLATLSVKHPEAARAIARRNENVLTFPLQSAGTRRNAVRVALRMAMASVG